MSVPKSEIIKLYRGLVREAKKFPAYNFRTYFLRRIRHGFQENKTLTDPAQIKAHYQDGLTNYDILKRQVIISGMFTERGSSIMEKLIANRKKKK